MRNVWVLLAVISALLLTFSVIFASRTSRISSGWSSDHAIVDVTELTREGEALIAKSRSDQPLWMQKLVDGNQTHRLPATESVISWDLVDPAFRLNTVLVLRLVKPDEYEALCLEQFFASRGIEHIVSITEFYDVRLKSKEEEFAAALITELATYDLYAELVVLKEPKPY
ncbi:hypothetical protein AGMMS50229_04410 [Campylobacterota bacterium]|nr:hypothetical protein AGMMS50229_04410 [Campylobacterota bacterium]